MTTDVPHQRSRWRAVRRILLQLVLVLVVYVLSVGPMYWKIYEAYYLNGSPFIAQFYLPLILLYEHSEIARAVLNWYIGLWIL